MCVPTCVHPIIAQLAHHSRRGHAGEKRGPDGPRGRVQNHCGGERGPRVAAANLRRPHRVRRRHYHGPTNHRVALAALQGLGCGVGKYEYSG